MSTNVKTKSTIKTKQRFIRITLDPKLERILSLLQDEFPLLDNIEIIKMLISIGYKNHQKTKTLKDVLAGQQFIDIESEEE